jgi:hypothetical protein
MVADSQLKRLTGLDKTIRHITIPRVQVARFCGSDILDVQLPRYEIDLRVSVQGLLDDELCVACGRHCLIFVGWVRLNSNNTIEVLIILGCNIYRGCY